MPDQLGPASGTRVAGRHGRYRQRPVDRKIRIVVRDAEVLGGIVRTIDPIAHIGSRGQRLEAVEEAGRDVQSAETRCRRAGMPAAGRTSASPFRISTNTSWTAPWAQRTSFASPRPDRPCMPRMASSHRPRLGVLDEGCRGSWSAEIFVEDVRVEGPREQPAVVVERLRGKNQNVREAGRFDTHMEMLT